MVADFCSPGLIGCYRLRGSEIGGRRRNPEGLGDSFHCVLSPIGGEGWDGARRPGWAFRRTWGVGTSMFRLSACLLERPSCCLFLEPAVFLLDDQRNHSRVK